MGLHPTLLLTLLPLQWPRGEKAGVASKPRWSLCPCTQALSLEDLLPPLPRPSLIPPDSEGRTPAEAHAGRQALLLPEPGLIPACSHLVGPGQRGRFRGYASVQAHWGPQPRGRGPASAAKWSRAGKQCLLSGKARRTYWQLPLRKALAQAQG